MRLQLVFTAILISHMVVYGQSTNFSSTDTPDDPRLENDGSNGIDVNFLFGYYQQEGNHSAVTGGIGTEELRDRDFRFIINIPLDSVRKLDVNAGVNFYSSASTDNIDTKVSSASSRDVRSQIYFNYSRTLPETGSSYSIGWGGSVESDYISTSFSAAWSKILSGGNRQVDIAAQAYFDNWVLIIPEELRVPETELPTTDRRRSYNLAAVLQQVINPRLQLGISAEFVYQTGLLSTPFHRVYFVEQDTAKIEKLPSHRFKVPLSLRLNYFLSDFLVIRSFLRYYHDNFSIGAFTTSLEPRVKLDPFFTIYPFYRYHHQSSASYFNNYKMHRLSQSYYTSDFDLSRFDSHSFGLGLHWSPLYGIGRFRLFSRKKLTVFRNIDMRYTHYRRSDGLNSNLIGLNLGFNRMK